MRLGPPRSRSSSASYNVPKPFEKEASIGAQCSHPLFTLKQPDQSGFHILRRSGMDGRAVTVAASIGHLVQEPRDILRSLAPVAEDEYRTLPKLRSLSSMGPRWPASVFSQRRSRLRALRKYSPSTVAARRANAWHRPSAVVYVLAAKWSVVSSRSVCRTGA